MVRRGAARHPGAMIEVDNLSKRYGDTAVVRDVSFRCDPGTVTGFLIATFLTLWAVSGQLFTLVVVIYETNTGIASVCIAVIFNLFALGLLIPYAWRTMGAILRYTPPTDAVAAPRRWYLL